MKFKNLILPSLILTFFTNCSVNKRFIYNYVNFDINKEKKIVVEVPRKYKLIKINEKELKIVYKDSTTIFFSYDKLSGTQSNRKNRGKEGIDVIFREHYNDTIILKGIDNKNLYWKECFFDDIIIGYINVPQIKKDEFDNIIASLRRK